MNVRSLLKVLALAGLAVVFCGCEEALCPTAQQYRDQQKFREAVDSYRGCLEGEKPNSQRAQSLREEIGTITRRIVDQELPKLDVPTSATLPEYDELLNQLEGLKAYDDREGRVASRMEKYSDARQQIADEVQQLLRTSSERQEAKDWSGAVESVDQALAKHPQSADATTLRGKIIVERDTDYSDRIKTFCREEKWAEADALLRSFGNEQPRPQADVIEPVVSLVANAKGNIVRKRAGQDIDEQRYFEAYMRIRDAAAQDECKDLLARIESEGYSHYAKLAGDMLNDVRYFHAYIAAVKASMLPIPARTAEEDPEAVIFDLHRRCSDLVDDSIQMEICIAAFDPPADDLAAGRQFADRLVGYLRPHLPYGLKLDDRRKVEYAVVEESGMRDRLRLVGVNWAVQGNLDISILPSRTETNVTAWAPVTQTVANPQYQEDINALVKQFGADSSKWPRQPPRTVTMELTQKVEYKTGVERLEGEIFVSANIYSAADGTITDQNDFRVARDVNDTFSDGMEQAGIKADPLEMISELDFRRQLEQEILQKITDWLLERFGRRQTAFHEQVQGHIERREWDEAVRAAAQGYFYCLKDEVPEDDELFVKLRRLALFDLTESTPGGRIPTP